MSKSEDVIIQDYEKLISNKIIDIANTYHDRLCMSNASGFSQKCGCCKKDVTTTTSIEHDSRDYSKDLSICVDCYVKIVEYWKTNKPNKISPI